MAGGIAAPARLHAYPVRDISSCTMQRWQGHFDHLGKGVIVWDTTSRALSFWFGDGQTFTSHRSSVPASEALTKRGRPRPHP